MAQTHQSYSLVGETHRARVGDKLYVKASGTSLATMMPDGFVAMDRLQLDALANATLDSDPDTREAQFQAAISAARCEPQKGQRPSVEVLLHHLLPGTYVVHSHATIVNTLTCSLDGRQLAKDIFGDSVLWLPYVDPGFTLAQSLKTALAEHAKSQSQPVKVVLMANHGLIIAGDAAAEIRETTDNVLSRIADRLGSDWATTSFGVPKFTGDASRAVRRIAPVLRGLMASSNTGILKTVVFDDSAVAQSLVGTHSGKVAATAGPLTPDQIVYCGSYPLWFTPNAEEDDETLVVRLRIAH